MHLCVETGEKKKERKKEKYTPLCAAVGTASHQQGWILHDVNDL
jgi:hypothetical protein